MLGGPWTASFSILPLQDKPAIKKQNAINLEESTQQGAALLLKTIRFAAYHCSNLI